MRTGWDMDDDAANLPSYPPDGEKRARPRYKRIKGAKIVYGDGHRVLDCAIKDLSEFGARVRLDVMVELPGTFWIYFQDGSPKRHAELVWRKGNLLGVRFLDVTGLRSERPSAGSARYAVLDRITLIEKQLAAMRAELTVLLRD